MTSIALAAIKIPVPAEAVPWIIGLFLLLVIAVSVYLTGPLWKVWGFPAWAVVALAGILASVLQALPGLPYSLPDLVAFNVLPAAALVWSALLFWGLRRRMDVKGALFAAVAYALVSAPLGPIMFGLRTGGFPDLSDLLHPKILLSSAVSGAGLLVTLALIKARVAPAWRVALVGLAAGQIVANLALQALASPGASSWPRAIVWSVVEGAILGGLGAWTVRWLKPEEQTVRVALRPAGRS